MSVVEKLEKDEAQYCSLNKRVDKVVDLLVDRQKALKTNVTNDVVIETIQSKLQEDELEKEEQLKQKKNVIVFGLEESTSNDAGVRVDEDLESMQSVVSKLELQQEADITKIIRLGRKPDQPDAKPRPLMVTLQSEEAKMELLHMAKNLRKFKEGGLDRIYIYPDMTPKQREARKKLVIELKSRQSNGESGLIIAESRIIKKLIQTE